MSGFRYLLAFGSNLGDRHRNLDEALRRLSPFLVIRAQSRRLETDPLPSTTFDVSDHGPYVNLVVEAQSPLAPQALYARIREVEDALGHPRDTRWRPREIDVDILLCALEPVDLVPEAGQRVGEAPPPCAFTRCIPFRVRSARKAPEDLRVPHAGLATRPFLRTLLVDDLKLPQACLGA